MLFKRLFFWLLFVCILGTISAQSATDRLRRIERRLEALIENGVPLEKEITISFTGSIQELVTFLAESTELSVGIDPEIRRQVSVTFTGVMVRDVILYLCDTYSLSMRPTGTIVYLINYVPPPVAPLEREPAIEYNTASGLVSLNLKRDTLIDVIRILTEKSGQNVNVDPVIQRKLVSGFVNNVSVSASLSQLAINNDLELSERGGLPYLTEKKRDTFFSNSGEDSDRPLSQPGINIRKTADNRVDVRAEGVSAIDVIQAIATELDRQFYVLEDFKVANSARNSNVNGSSNRTDNRRTNQSTNGSTINSFPSELGDMIVTLQTRNATFDEILTNMFRNTSFTYQNDGTVYLIGSREAESLRSTSIVQFQYRSARGMMELIPESFLQGVRVDSLFELNSLILSGSKRNIEEIRGLLKSLDKVVPVVNIELTIIDVSSNKLDEYGIEAGVRPGGQPAGGTIVSSSENQGGIDFSYSPGAINQLLDLLAGRGIVNIGRVTPDFYLGLKALQEDGIVDIQSTPKLSTLNSHPASLSIGTKRYYQEQQVNYPGLDRPIPIQATIFKEIEANLLVNINPIVSGDEEVTLDIYFEQTEFLADTGPNAPPPQVSRRFESIIRVRNGETIILGGLERELESRTRRGVPFLSRIPVIGWLFGNKRKAKQKNKLLIVIKPTIIN